MKGTDGKRLDGKGGKWRKTYCKSKEKSDGVEKEDGSSLGRQGKERRRGWTWEGREKRLVKRKKYLPWPCALLGKWEARASNTSGAHQHHLICCVDNILTASSLDLHREKEDCAERQTQFGDSGRNTTNAIQLQRGSVGQEDPRCPRCPKTLIWNQLPPSYIHFDTITGQWSDSLDWPQSSGRASHLHRAGRGRNSGGLCLREERRREETNKRADRKKKRWRTDEVIDRRGESSLTGSTEREHFTSAIVRPPEQTQQLLSPISSPPPPLSPFTFCSLHCRSPPSPPLQSATHYYTLGMETLSFLSWGNTHTHTHSLTVEWINQHVQTKVVSWLSHSLMHR